MSPVLHTPLRQQFDAVHNDWLPLLQRFAGSAAGRALCDAVDGRVAAGACVYPPRVLRAFELTPLTGTRVVILGQDPYHGSGQAEGLAFSVPSAQGIPPSLRNIRRELQRDVGLAAPTTGSLVPWARQGVLLLNASLTVEDGRPGSHSKLGWQVLTDEVIETLCRDEAPKVFMLWGAHAQTQAPRVKAAGGRHLLLQCNHPSPLSAARGATPFLGCGHFGKARRFVAEAGRGALDWSLA